MALQLVNLDASTRQSMLAELANDIAHGTLYLSPRLTARGQMEWPTLLQEAIASQVPARV